MKHSVIRYLVVVVLCVLATGAVYAQQTLDDLKPSDLQAQKDYAAAQSAETASNYDQAIKLYGQVIAQEPAFWPAHYRRGEAYSIQQNYQAAIEDYSAVIKAQPDYALAYVTRSIAYEQLSDHTNAIADANKAIDLKTGEDYIYFNRGKAYLATKVYENAISDLTHWIDLNPKTYAVAYFYRSRAYYAVSNLPASVSDLDIFIELQPKSPSVLADRAYIQRLLGNYDKALSDYTAAIELKPDSIQDMYYERGRTYGLQGQYDAMLADLRVYAKLAGSSADSSVLDLLKNHPE